MTLDGTTTNDSSSDSNNRTKFARSPTNNLDAKKPRRWTPAENEALKAAVKRFNGKCWKKIAEEVRTRDHVQCLQRWKKVETPGLIKGQWAPEEDQLLKSAKEATPPPKNWGVVSKSVPGRTSKQCRERWRHHLDPAIEKKKTFTEEEDAKLLAAHAKWGNQWIKIASCLPGRTENSVKVRCKALSLKSTPPAPQRRTRTLVPEPSTTSLRSTRVSSSSSLSTSSWSNSSGESAVNGVGLQPLPSTSAPAPQSHGNYTNSCSSRGLFFDGKAFLDPRHHAATHPVAAPYHGGGGNVSARENALISTSAPAHPSSAQGAWFGGGPEVSGVTDYPAWFTQLPAAKPIYGSGSVNGDDDKLDEIDDMFLEALNTLE